MSFKSTSLNEMLFCLQLERKRNRIRLKIEILNISLNRCEQVRCHISLANELNSIFFFSNKSTIKLANGGFFTRKLGASIRSYKNIVTHRYRSTIYRHRKKTHTHVKKKSMGTRKKKVMNEKYWMRMNECKSAPLTKQNLIHTEQYVCVTTVLYYIILVFFPATVTVASVAGFVTASNRINVGGYNRYNHFGRRWCLVLRSRDVDSCRDW